VSHLGPFDVNATGSIFREESGFRNTRISAAQTPTIGPSDIEVKGVPDATNDGLAQITFERRLSA
jgi:hypothetical protein